MLKNFVEDSKNYLENNSKIYNFITTTMENLSEAQNKFLQSNIGQAINQGVNMGLKAILPNCIEDEVIAVKEALITEGFSAAVDVAVEEASNLGKSLSGIVTGSFENISQIKKAIEKGGLVDTISDILESGINWAKKNGYISKEIASTIKKGKNTMLNIVKDGIDNTLLNQVESIEKINGYVNKWKKYYDEKNFKNMEYQYEKIEENLEKVIPLEDILKKARMVENLHELIKNNGKNFDITNEEKELAEMLAY